MAVPTTNCSLTGDAESVGALAPQVPTVKLWSNGADERPVESVAVRRTRYVPETSATKLGEEADGLLSVAALPAGMPTSFHWYETAWFCVAVQTPSVVALSGSLTSLLRTTVAPTAKLLVTVDRAASRAVIALL